MILQDVVEDVLTALQSDFPDVVIHLGTLPQQGILTERVSVAVSVERYANARSREPFGDSPIAPGDYEISLRFEVGAPRVGLPAAYESIEAIYLWSQSQDRRHTTAYHYSLPTPLQFVMNGDVVVGVWAVTFRVRRQRG